MSVITIIGSGMMGSALAFPALENGHKVRLVGSPLDGEIIDVCRREGKHPKFEKAFPAGIEYYKIDDVGTALEGTDLVIGGISSFGVDWFGEWMLPRIPETIPVLTVTKGLYDTEDGDLITYPELWKRKMKAAGRKPVILSVGGPCTSYELVAHDQTMVAFCGDDMETLRFAKSLMETDYYHVSITTDVTGIESAVALKNGYALAVSLTIGVNQKEFGIDSELHFNSQAGVFYQAVREMQKLLDIQGTGSLDNLAIGLGDLYVTVYGGRTRKIGILLGRGLDIDEALKELNGVTLESLVVAKRVVRAIKKKAEKGEVNLSDFPLLIHVDDIISEHMDVNIPWNRFVFGS